jgi:hypothetical protein
MEKHLESGWTREVAQEEICVDLPTQTTDVLF